MIPGHDPGTGYLPPGRHLATWHEFVARYAANPHRRALATGLKEALDVLRAARCRRVYIAGSFVTEKLDPGDFDGVFEIEGVDQQVLRTQAPELLDQAPPRASQQARFKGELLIIEESLGAAGVFNLEFFEQDRSGVSKGVIAIDLEGLP